MRKGLSFLSLVALFAVFSCFPNLESELEKAIERDDRLVQDFLQRNNIDAIETPLGYFYKKIESSATGNQVVNNDILGIYYEIRTINDQLIENYLDESKPPRIFSHSEGGMVPRAINFAAGLAKEGEVFELYVPSYLAYQDFSYQNLIFPSSNLKITVKFAKIFTEEEIEEWEDALILDYISENNLEGFEKTDDGYYIKILSDGDDESKEAEEGNVVAFTFRLFQLGESEALSEMTNELNAPQISLGSPINLDFLNLSMIGKKEQAEFEIISPSRLAYGPTTQVLPFVIRRELFDRGSISFIARPFEPVMASFRMVQVGTPG